MKTQGAQRIGREGQTGLGVLDTIVVQESLRHHDDVVPPLPQGRDLDDHNGQAEVQVLAKLPAGDGLLQVPVRGREDAGVARNLLPAPNTLEAFLLKKAQKLHLDRRRQLADLIEEERAARGGLDVPFALRVGTRERAFLVAEEFALEQVLRDRVAVDGDERSAGLLRSGDGAPAPPFPCPCRFRPESAPGRWWGPPCG